MDPSAIDEMEMEGSGTGKVAVSQKEDIYFEADVAVAVEAGESLRGKGFSCSVTLSSSADSSSAHDSASAPERLTWELLNCDTVVTELYTVCYSWGKKKRKIKKCSV